MSDYLGKLVSRSLSPPTVVQPRLLSLFEPPRTNRELVLGSDIEPAPPDAEQVRERSPSAVRAPQLQFLRSSEPNLQDAGQTSQARLGRIQPEAVKLVEPREIDASASASSQARAAGSAPVPGRKSPGQRTQTRTPLPASMETVTPEAVPQAVEPVSPLPSEAPVTPLPEGTERPGSETAHPRLRHREDNSAKRSRANNQKTNEISAPTTSEAKTREAASARPGDTSEGREGKQRSQQQMPPKLTSVKQTGADERPKSLPILPVVPASTVPSPHLLPPSTKREHVAERPSIHVTIGRVEVRATPLPARARPQAPQARAMSLDEYLRQRASGGSR